MVNATELRLGNRLWWNPSAGTTSTLPPLQVEVAEITANAIGYFSPRVEHRVEPFEDDLLQTQTPHRPLEEFEPIPLTKESIERCSLEKSENGWQAVSLEAQAGGYELALETGKLCRVDYLHQLQNLYYAVTGEELEIEG